MASSAIALWEKKISKGEANLYLSIVWAKPAAKDFGNRTFDEKSRALHFARRLLVAGQYVRRSENGRTFNPNYFLRNLGYLGTERVAQARNQLLVAEGLLQKSNSSGFQRSVTSLLLRIGRYKDDGCPMATRDQMVLQVNTRHTRHLHVCDQARRVSHIPRLKILFSGSKRGGLKAERSDQALCGFANGFVVIDN
jgi:hypothetical protein